MDPNKPVTKEEALQYDSTAIEANIVKQRNDIDMLRGKVPDEEIARMENDIQRLYQIKAIIDANK